MAPPDAAQAPCGIPVELLDIVRQVLRTAILESAIRMLH